MWEASYGGWRPVVAVARQLVAADSELQAAIDGLVLRIGAGRVKRKKSRGRKMRK